MAGAEPAETSRALGVDPTAVISEVVTGFPVAMLILLIGDLEAVGAIFPFSPSLVGPALGVFSMVSRGIDSTTELDGFPG